MINFFKSMFTGHSGNISAMRFVQVVGVLMLIAIVGFVAIFTAYKGHYTEWQGVHICYIIGILVAGKVGQAFSGKKKEDA